MRRYEDLKVWQKAVDLAVEVFEITKSFPREEIYGLSSQVRRCAFSIPSNIAEGSERNSDKEFSRFINIALGSLAELKTQVIIAGKVNIISLSVTEGLKIKIDEIGKMLKALRNKFMLETSDKRPETKK